MVRIGYGTETIVLRSLGPDSTRKWVWQQLKHSLIFAQSANIHCQVIAGQRYLDRLKFSLPGPTEMNNKGVGHDTTVKAVALPLFYNLEHLPTRKDLEK